MLEPAEAARTCAFAILNWFDSEDPFWGSFVPRPESTELADGRFAVSLRGQGATLEVHGTMIPDFEEPRALSPSICVAGRRDGDESAPQCWHPIACSLSVQGRFATHNFRNAVDAALADVKA
jgi:hypothetical protein